MCHTLTLNHTTDHCDHPTTSHQSYFLAPLCAPHQSFKIIKALKSEYIQYSKKETSKRSQQQKLLNH